MQQSLPSTIPTSLLLTIAGTAATRLSLRALAVHHRVRTHARKAQAEGSSDRPTDLGVVLNLRRREAGWGCASGGAGGARGL